MFLLVVASTNGCSGKTDGGAPKADMGPIPECVQYQSALDACFHRDSGFATKPAMLPTTQADRLRLQQACAENLERLKKACR